MELITPWNYFTLCLCANRPEELPCHRQPLYYHKFGRHSKVRSRSILVVYMETNWHARSYFCLAHNGHVLFQKCKLGMWFAILGAKVFCPLLFIVMRRSSSFARLHNPVPLNDWMTYLCHFDKRNLVGFIEHTAKVSLGHLISVINHISFAHSYESSAIFECFCR